MKLLYIPYIFVIVQLLCVSFYVQILNKKFKVPCKYGMQVSWSIPFIITIILFILLTLFNYMKNEENIEINTEYYSSFTDNIGLFLGIFPLIPISIYISILSSGVTNAAGMMEPYCM